VREEGKESVTITATLRGKGKELKLRQEKNAKPYEHETESLQACVKTVSDLFLFIKSAVKHPPAPLFASPGVLLHLEIHSAASAGETPGCVGKSPHFRAR